MGKEKCPGKGALVVPPNPDGPGACWASLQPGRLPSKAVLSSVPLPPSDQHTGFDTPPLTVTPSLHQPMSMSLSHPSCLCVNVTFSLRMPFALLKLQPLPQPHAFPLPASLFSTAFYRLNGDELEPTPEIVKDREAGVLQSWGCRVGPD